MRILNIGCGRDLSVGTDFVDKFPSLPCVKPYDADTEKLPYFDETFDEVYCSFVFEHLTNHHNFMTETRRVLKPNGRLRIITDNALFIVHFKTGHEYIPLEDNGDRHFMVFTPEHLKAFAHRYGFEVIVSSYIFDYTSKKIQNMVFFHALNAVFPKLAAGKIECMMIKKEG